MAFAFILDRMKIGYHRQDMENTDRPWTCLWNENEDKKMKRHDSGVGFSLNKPADNDMCLCVGWTLQHGARARAAAPRPLPSPRRAALQTRSFSIYVACLAYHA